MKRAMVVTVGTGTGEHRQEVLKGLSEAIVTSILNNRPDKVVFIASKQSKEETVPLIVPRLGDMEYTDVIIEQIDDIQHIFEKASYCIQELVDEGFDTGEIVVDYTSGTKAMSAGVVLAALSFEVGKIAYISGKRGERGVVSKGTEKFTIMRPVQMLMQKKIDLVGHFFNAHRFESCLEILEHVGSHLSGRRAVSIVDELTSLCKVYDLWDKFDHKGAADILLGSRFSLLDVSQNKKFLGCMKKESEDFKSGKGDVELFYIADIMNNCDRRAEEGRCDDAVARLYRVFELLAQWHIRKMGLCDEKDLKRGNYSIDSSRLKEEQTEYFEELGYSESDKIKPGLFDSYYFLARCEHPMGLEFEGDKQLHHLLSGRNNSILAHGLRSVGRVVYLGLFKKCSGYIEKYVDVDIGEYRKLARFPKVEHVPSIFW